VLGGSGCRPNTADCSRPSRLDLVAVIKQAINPRTDLPDRLTSSSAIQLFIEGVVVAELDRPGQRACRARSRRCEPCVRIGQQGHGPHVSARTRPSVSASWSIVPGTWPHSSTYLRGTTTTSAATLSGSSAFRKRTISFALLATDGSITRKSKSLSVVASPRPCDPNRITFDSAGAASARRRPACSRISAVVIASTLPQWAAESGPSSHMIPSAADPRAARIGRTHPPPGLGGPFMRRQPRRSRLLGIQTMGDPGLEPGTSSLSEKRSNRLS
jgi:hypothetical protein